MKLKRLLPIQHWVIAIAKPAWLNTVKKDEEQKNQSVLMKLYRKRQINNEKKDVKKDLGLSG